MLLNVAQYTGRPTTKIHPVKNINSAEVEKCCINEDLSVKQLGGELFCSKSIIIKKSVVVMPSTRLNDGRKLEAI